MAYPDAFGGRLRETTATTGTGTITLGGAVSGHEAFSARLSDGDVISYSIEDGVAFEYGRGTYSSGTLTRDTVEGSSNADAKISLSGNAQVGVAMSADLAGRKLSEGVFYLKGDEDTDGSIRIIEVSGNVEIQKRISSVWEWGTKVEW